MTEPYHAPEPRLPDGPPAGIGPDRASEAPGTTRAGHADGPAGGQRDARGGRPRRRPADSRQGSVTPGIAMVGGAKGSGVAAGLGPTPGMTGTKGVGIGGTVGGAAEADGDGAPDGCAIP